MTISAQIIADSISPAGIRLTTMQLRYPRFIHAEAKTHRIINIDGTMYEEFLDYGFMDDANLSRNASSSRAIPVERMIEDIRRDPAMPVFWGSNQKGMQAGAELTGLDYQDAMAYWKDAMLEAIKYAEKLISLGLHKQIANRILEPWAHINVVVTATDWENFYTLRRHKDAQPEIKVLADKMWEAQQDSSANRLEPGEWHLPYISTPETFEHDVELLKKVSVARCARVSYLTHDGRQTTIEEDLALYDRLLGAQPLHASPAEHQATPDVEITNGNYGIWSQPNLHGNLTGWIQYRKTLPGEFIPG